MKIITEGNSKMTAPFIDGMSDLKGEIHHRKYPREELSEILEKYNHEIGNDSEAIQNIKRFRLSESMCVFTGQQAGFMGGPTYTILKAISTLLLARQLGAIPIFWIASEDHDITEINHTTVLGSDGNLKKFHLNFPKGKHFVEDLILTKQHLEEIESFFHFLQIPNPLQKSFCTEGVNYSTSMAHIMAYLFQNTGLLFVEPYLLRTLGLPFFKKEIEEAGLIATILQIEERETNLFYKAENGFRLKIRRNGTSFLIGQDVISQIDLIQHLEKNPERFSTNVFSRPLLQNFLFPTIAYVGGPSEMSYLSQLTEYHKLHKVPMPLLIPRISATIITPDAASFLEKAHLEPWQLTFGDQKRGQGHGFHLLHNLFFPKNKPQERILNWWGFQARVERNLVQECMNQMDWKETQHLYCYV